MSRLTLGPLNYTIDAGITTAGGFGTMWPWWKPPLATARVGDGYEFQYPDWTYLVLPTEDELGIHFSVTVTNRQAVAAVPWGFHLGAFTNLPTLIQNWNVGHGYAEPGAMQWQMPDGSWMSFIGESPRFAAKMHFWPVDSPWRGRAYFAVRPDDNEQISPQKVEPGKSVTAKFSINFNPRQVSPLVTRALANWRSSRPQKLAWPDRRPITTLFPSGATVRVGNPNGWLAQLNTDDPSTHPQFRTWLLAHADGAVVTARNANAQGTVVWNIEGMKHRSFTYYGNPELAQELSPELNGVLDDFFKKFRDAGLQVGVCVRPWQLELNDDKTPRLSEVNDPLKALESHIAYMRSRFGCKLFYIDSFYRQALADLAELQAEFPDCLLMPEAWSPGQCNRAFGAYGATCLVDANGVITIDRTLYTKSFGVHLSWMQRVGLPGELEKLVAAVKAGDVLFINGWYQDGSSGKANEIYTAAGRPLW
jgi:hypothetical protein